MNILKSKSVEDILQNGLNTSLLRKINVVGQPVCLSIANEIAYVKNNLKGDLVLNPEHGYLVEDFRIVSQTR